MKKMLAWSGLLCAACVWTGCAEKQGDMAMTPPPRPPQLDRLEMWVGVWDNSGEMKACNGKLMKTHGTHDVKWDLNKNLLIERLSADMEGMPPMNGIGIYSYDYREKEFKYRYYGEHGDTMHGELDYNEKSGVWTMKTKGYNPMMKMTTTGQGTFCFPDANTINWTWKEWDGLHLAKLFEGTGTVKRK